MPGESSTTPSAELVAALKRHFGFDTFRPQQAAIIDAYREGRDVFALLPTGGGKSLCFQLPAMMDQGLTVVISPLIALMKDQVDGLVSAGLPATFLNSSLAAWEARERTVDLEQGVYRLLYVSPERLLMPGFFEDLARFGMTRLAVDEAHCISEWGHDFRPEYRRIAEVRERFPKLPIMAMTATATTRVRSDVIEGLKLRQPAVHVASFDRRNLVYRVIPKEGATDQMLDFLRARPNAAGIVYCFSRKSAEAVAASLQEAGYPAAPYHAGLDAEDRARNQEAFLRDDVRVICATVAFGMGINKPDVRFVVHYDLPKNLEGYYQETGRAGRDGLPSDCLLIYNPGDAMKIRHFIGEKATAQERKVASAQLKRMVEFAETSACRRAFVLDYFGERFEEENCQACDNCLGSRESYDGTLLAQKLMSCVFRIREREGFDMGLGHVVEVLAGADTQRIRDRNHTTLSTYGIGRDVPRDEWRAVGRELVRLGLLVETADDFATLSLSPAGRMVLSKRMPVTLTRLPREKVRAAERSAATVECDEELFDVLRRLRKRLAEGRGLRTYMVFNDASLREMARRYPADDTEFLSVSGVGPVKLAEYGTEFMDAIREHVARNGRREFAAKPPPPPAPREPAKARGPMFASASLHESVRLLHEGLTPELVAARRGLAPGTIYEHLAQAVEAGVSVNVSSFITDDVRLAAEAVLQEVGDGPLRLAFERCGGEIRYEILRIVRAGLRRAGSQPR